MSCIWIVLLMTVASITQRAVCTHTTFRAAVYEHAVHIPVDSLIWVVSRKTAVKNMMKNVNVYMEQAAVAGSQNVNILVFPEDGIYGMVFNRQTIKPYLEDIPDPSVINWNPCDDPKRYHESDIQTALSCIAKRNSLYVVANMGDRKLCNRTEDPNCPHDSQYQFNTDVVYDPNGVFIARYHKEHLFGESQFNTPKKVEIVTFETPFGRFGIFTCYDILFSDPAVVLVKKYGVENLLFPTAWMDDLPQLAAIQFHSAFARGLGVNVLGANIHFPLVRFHGSGIYTPRGALAYYYDDGIFSGGKLLIADVVSRGINNTKGITCRKKVPNADSESKGNSKSNLSEVLTLHKQWNTGYSRYYHRNMNNNSLKEMSHFRKQLETHGNSLKTYKSAITTFDSDVFNFVPLNGESGQLKLCHKKTCCFVEYNKDDVSSQGDLYAFGVFDGLESGRYTQICTVIKCQTRDPKSCGEPTKSAKTKFKHLELSGTFSTSTIFPEVIVSREGLLGLADDDWEYRAGEIVSTNGFNEPLLTASLYARMYNWDNRTRPY